MQTKDIILCSLCGLLLALSIIGLKDQTHRPLIFDKMISHKVTAKSKPMEKIFYFRHSFTALAHFQDCEDRFIYSFQTLQTESNVSYLFWSFDGLIELEEKNCQIRSACIGIFFIFGIFLSIGIFVLGLMQAE